MGWSAGWARSGQVRQQGAQLPFALHAMALSSTSFLMAARWVEVQGRRRGHLTGRKEQPATGAARHQLQWRVIPVQKKIMRWQTRR